MRRAGEIDLSLFTRNSGLKLRALLLRVEEPRLQYWMSKGSRIVSARPEQLRPFNCVSQRASLRRAAHEYGAAVLGHFDAGREEEGRTEDGRRDWQHLYIDACAVLSGRSQLLHDYNV